MGTHVVNNSIRILLIHVRVSFRGHVAKDHSFILRTCKLRSSEPEFVINPKTVQKSNEKQRLKDREKIIEKVSSILGILYWRRIFFMKKYSMNRK